MYKTEDAADIYWGEHPDFEQDPIAVVDMGSRRWHHDWRHIMKRTSDGTFWAVDGQIALTERQEHEFSDRPFQVFQREVEIPAKVEIRYVNDVGVEVG